ncbi:hypothetical protein BpHYR1_018391 [Brachionus plicatilis]|uniref:Uncharacterized protein n=1 Tax=Brachionus plicatilis TaxID=10195 RepID=A0A3M7P6K4_BRAPC|nr:hypothetical protein BpHYR1_018391 [Brachionus plicatilis]
MGELNFKIETTWNNETINHEPVKFTFEPDADSVGLVIKIDAPFFNDPAKPSEKIGEFFNLWDYEVAEVFFLNKEGKYLELEFGPHGHFVSILFKGPQDVVNKSLIVDYQAEISENRWSGIAKIPEAYFPINTTKMNAYAIHGSDKNRVYESLFPTPNGKYEHPNFHRLEYFRNINLMTQIPQNYNRLFDSDLWNIDQNESLN